MHGSLHLPMFCFCDQETVVAAYTLSIFLKTARRSKAKAHRRPRLSCIGEALVGESEVASVAQLEAVAPANMVRIPGGTFRMGSDKHYPEEAPAHRVSVDGFWIDRTPVTNRQFKEFVRATGHVTFAEIKPDPKNYPGALPHMIFAGSLVFTPPDHPVDLRDWSQWWTLMKGARLAAPLRAEKQYQWARSSSGRPCRVRRCARLREMGRQGAADRGGMGICRARRARRRRIRLGRRVHARRQAHGQYLARQVSAPE